MSDKHLTANELAQNIQENVDNVVAVHNKSEATSALQAEANGLRDNANPRRSVRSDLSTIEAEEHLPAITIGDSGQIEAQGHYKTIQPQGHSNGGILGFIDGAVHDVGHDVADIGKDIAHHPEQAAIIGGAAIFGAATGTLWGLAGAAVMEDLGTSAAQYALTFGIGTAVVSEVLAPW